MYHDTMYSLHLGRGKHLKPWSFSCKRPCCATADLPIFLTKPQDLAFK